MTAATIGGWTVSLAGTEIEEVLSMSGLGKTRDQIEVTSFDTTAGTKEYIGGLADGAEITIEANYVATGTGQLAARAAVNTGTNVEMVATYGTTTEVFTYQVTPLAWSLSPSTTDQNRCEFQYKISGDIVVT